jgi:serine/threonine-protein kinase
MSKLIIVCEGCGAEREVDEKLAGTVLTCSNCQASIRIPLPDIGEGSVIGGFLLEKQLGFGSMGEVWLAHQKTMDRKVALKLLSREFTLDSQFVERFLKEVKISAKMDHPNMVTAFDAGCDNDIYFLAITFVDGSTLEDRLEEIGVFNEKDAIKVILDIASALKYAWDEFQIIHRDIKPANIMIDNKGVGKLMDLGISKSTHEEANLTMTGTIIGTPYYMSPEQGIGDRNLDFHTDIYSLGATLYHLVTGEVPFQATTALGIVSKHITEPFPPPQDKNPDVSDECSALLETMMAKDCDVRQDSWDAVITDMKLVLAGEFPASTKRPDPGDSLVMRAAAKTVSVNDTGREDSIPPASVDNLDTNIFAGKDGDNSPGHKNNSKMPIILGAVILFIVFGVLGLVLFSGKSDTDTGIGDPIADLPENIPEEKVVPLREDKEAVQPKENVVDKRIENAEDVKVIKQHFTVEGKSKESKDFEEMWKFASEFSANNAGKFDLAIANFKEISSSAGGTKYKMMADIEISKLTKQKAAAIAGVLKKLKLKADAFEKKRDYRSAADLYRSYSGIFADETAEARKENALSFDKKADAEEKAETAKKEALKKRQSDFYCKFASTLFSGNWKNAKLLAEKPPEKITLPKETLKILDELLNMNKALFSNIKKNIGKTISVDTSSGKQTIKVKRIKGNSIYIEEKKGRVVIQKKFSITQLTPGEKAKRAGLSDNAAALYLAADAFKRRDMEPGFRYLKKMKGSLSEILLGAGKERLAEISLKKFLKKLKLKTSSLDPEIIASELRERELSPIHKKKIDAAVQIYRKTFGNTQFAKRNEPLLALLEGGGIGEGDSSEHDNNPLAEDNEEIRSIEDLNRLLKDVSPEYRGDGRFIKSRGGHIILADLSGVRGIDNRSLTVLKRLALAELNLGNTDVTDISELKDMSIRNLSLRDCRVCDLSPLKEMKSLKKLSLFHTKVESLEALKNLRIEVLDIAENRVEDIAPLRGMPLKALRLFNCPIRDFSPLSRCKSLLFLDPWDTWRMIPGKEYKAENPPKRIPKDFFEHRPRNDDFRRPDRNFRDDYDR